MTNHDRLVIAASGCALTEVRCPDAGVLSRRSVGHGEVMHDVLFTEQSDSTSGARPCMWQVNGIAQANPSNDPVSLTIRPTGIPHRITATASIIQFGCSSAAVLPARAADATAVQISADVRNGEDRSHEPADPFAGDHTSGHREDVHGVVLQSGDSSAQRQARRGSETHVGKLLLPEVSEQRAGGHGSAVVALRQRERQAGSDRVRDPMAVFLGNDKVLEQEDDDTGDGQADGGVAGRSGERQAGLARNGDRDGTPSGDRGAGERAGVGGKVEDARVGAREKDEEAGDEEN